MTSFTELGISKDIIRAMNGMGWESPTPVQIEAIPVGLKGGDMFAQAQTGTGKTGAFGSIILQRTKPGMKQPSALVLVPTRELANQVFEELYKLSEFTGHSSVPIYGGVGYFPQVAKLRRGTDIVVATPGRAKDLINRKDLDLSMVSVVVLDEADRMLDMGFARDLNFLLSKVPKKRQTLLFSATMSKDIRQLALRQMVDPLEILVSKDEPVLDLTKQYYLIINKEAKRDALCTILDENRPKAIVFCHTKHKVKQLAKKLEADRYLAGALHGDVSQNKRDKVMKGFKEGSLDILVATDVAARGLDIEGVDYVINFDAPVDAETYVHRIGRTGRAGNEGTAVSFFTPDEKGMIKGIMSKTGKPIDPLDLKIVRRPEPELKKVVEVRTRVQEQRPSDQGRNAQRRSVGRGRFVEINFGNADGLNKADIVDMMRAGTELTPQDIGSIAMGERFTHVEILKKDARQISMSLTGHTFKGKTVDARTL